MSLTRRRRLVDCSKVSDVSGGTTRRHKLLFFDWRDVDCGHVLWQTPEGDTIDVTAADEPQRDVHARPSGVPYGIRLQAQPARTTDPFTGWRGWGRTIYHDGKYRSWFLEIDGNSQLGSGSRAQRRDRQAVVVCAVESEDGMHWSDVGRCPLEVPGQYGFDGFTFFIDPVAPAASRYKIVYCASVPDQLSRPLFEARKERAAQCHDEREIGKPGPCLMCATSPDGLRWTACSRPLMMHTSDTDTTVYWDAQIEKYVLYTRLFCQTRRWIGRAESDDFFSWGPVEPVLWPRLDDPPDYDLYLNGRSTYPGLPEYQLLFPLVYQRFTERSHVRLHASTDGVAWNQVPGGPVIQPGESGAWDSEFIGSGKDLLPFGVGRVAIPYTATEYPHKYPRWSAVWDAWKAGWAWWPEDRLCGLVADREGQFQTVPMYPGGRRLRANCRTQRAGEVCIGIQGVEGRSAESCDPLHGDLSNAQVTWQGASDAGFRDGEPIRLQVRLRCAELYALEWV